MLCTAIANIQWAAYKVILYIDDEKCVDWANNLKRQNQNNIRQNRIEFISSVNIYSFDPIVPAKLKFVAINEAILVHIKDVKHLFELIIRHNIDVAFIVAKQCSAYEREFSQW